MMYALGPFSGKQFPYDGRLNADTKPSLFVCKQPLGGGGSGHTPSGHSNHWEEEGSQWSYT